MRRRIEHRFFKPYLTCHYIRRIRWRVDLRTHISLTRVSISTVLECLMFTWLQNLVGSRCTRDAPTFLNLIQPFRWIVVRQAMKPGISTIALPQIVALLVRPSSLPNSTACVT